MSQTVIRPDDVDPLRLTTSPLKVQKQFEYNYVDSKKPEDSVTLELYSMTDEGEWEKTFKTITLDAVYQTDDDGNYVDAEGRILHEADGKYCDAEGIERERVLVEAESWYSEKNFVSYGLVTYDEDDPNGTSKVYETGHDFTLRESGINAHYYELEAQTYRPMYINGLLLSGTLQYSDVQALPYFYLSMECLFFCYIQIG